MLFESRLSGREEFILSVVVVTVVFKQFLWSGDFLCLLSCGADKKVRRHAGERDEKIARGEAYYSILIMIRVFQYTKQEKY